MKGLIWPSKNRRNSGLGNNPSTSSSSLGRSKNASSTRSLSPSTPAPQSKKNSGNGSSGGSHKGSEKNTDQPEAQGNRRKSSATLSLRSHTNPNNSRSSGNVYLTDSHSKSMKSVASSSHRADETSIVSSGSIPGGSLSEADVNAPADESDVTLDQVESLASGEAIGSSQSVGMDEERKIGSSVVSASTERKVSLNKENYDSVVFKSGWLNRSNHMSNSVSTHHLRSGSHSTGSNRESRFYHDTSETPSNIPEFRVHRAQLKGPVLNLYKSGLPNAVKYFDPTAVGSTEESTLASTNSSADTLTRKQSDDQTPMIKYLSDKYPHPNMKLDNDGKILSGSVESLCHTVLFAHPDAATDDVKSQRAIVNLILILPLADHFVYFLRIFNQFGLTFTKHSSRVSNSAGQYCNVSANVDNLMTERLGLVVKTILDMFPSFLLDDKMFQEVINLLDTISLHNDEISNYLKISVADKHNELSKLTAFSRNTSSQRSSSKDIDARKIKLQKEIMNVDSFLTMDLDKLAMQVHKINLKFDSVWAPRFDYSLLYDCQYINADIIALNPLTFNNKKNVHFLGRLLTCHLFGNDCKAGQHAKLGAKVLTKWVEFGGKFEALGDMVSWLAVATVICSIPILRLKSLWTHVPEHILRTIFKDWIPTIAQLDRRHLSSKSTSSVFILAPPNLDNPFIKSNVISYFGDLMIHADDLPPESKFKYLERKVNRTKNAFYKWQQRLERIKSGHPDTSFDFKDVSPSESVVYQFWRYHLFQPCLNTNDLMKLSLDFEPPKVDQKSYSDVGGQRSPLSSGGFLPILFNEVCPNYSLFSQESLIGAAGVLDSSGDSMTSSEASSRPFEQSPSDYIPSELEGDSTKIVPVENHVTGFTQIDAPLMKELSSKQSNRQHMLKCIRDAFNVDSDIFHVADDLIFKSVNDLDVNSRPSSMVIETPKRFSQQSLSHGNFSGQRDVDDTPSRLSKTLENMDFFSNIGKVSETLKETLIEVVLKSGSLEKLYDLLVLTASIFSKLIDTKNLEKYYQHKRHRSQLRAARSSFMETDSIGLLDYAFVKLTMDMDVYTETFFNSYKSFTTTTSVIENLAKRYVGAKSCAFFISQFLNTSSESKSQSYDSHQNVKRFPVWDAKLGDNDSVSPIFWAKIQVGTAEAILNLVKHHYADFTDDLNSNVTLLDFLKIMEQDVTNEWPRRMKMIKESNFNEELTETESLVSTLHELFNSIRSCYQRQLYRPLGIDRTCRKVAGLLNSFHKMSIMDYTKYLSSNEFDDPMVSAFRQLKYDQYESLMQWVSSMDSFVLKKLQFAGKQDWFATFQKLEATSCESLTSLYCLPLHSSSYNLVTSGSARLDDLEVANVFTWISNLVADPAGGNKPVLDTLPEPIQLLIKLHVSLTNFFMVEIADLHKSAEERVSSCAVVLQILKYVRWKNSGLDLFKADDESNQNAISPHIPSFIETAIINAIVSPESRYFEHAWSSANEILSSSGKPTPVNISTILMEIEENTLESFRDSDSTLISSLKNLCPCPGWIIQRLLEISQFVPNMSIINSKLINFDKRRFVNNFVANSLDLTPVPDETNAGQNNTLFGISLFQSFVDSGKAFKRSTRNLAMTESKLLRYQERGLFNEILAKEVDKTRRDHKKIEVLSAQERDIKRSAILQQMIQRKQRSSVILPNLQTSDPTSSNITKISPSSMSSSLSGSTRDKRSSTASYSSRNSVISTSGHTHMGKKIGGFFKRPFSIGGFNSSASSSSLSSILIPGIQEDGSVSADNLPALDPTLIQEQKPILSIKTFEIKSIIEVINHQKDSAHFSSFKLLMHDGREHIFQATTKKDLIEWMEMIRASKRYAFHSKKYRGKTHNKLFGVPLEDVCEREGTTIPTIIVKLLEEIEIRGLDEVGLYRIPGSVGSVNALKNAFDQEGAVGNSFTLEDDRWFEINAIAGCFKMYLRELPDCLFSNERIGDFVRLAFQLRTSEISEEVYRAKMIAMLRELPTCYYHTLKLIFFHLNKVHQHMHNNRMDASNLAIVFSMSFINQDDLANSMGSTLGAVQGILQRFIKSPSDYFKI